MGLGGDLQLDDAVLPTPSNILHASIHGRQQLWRIETPKVCSATGRTPQINTVVDPIRWYRLTVVVCSQRTGWTEHPLGYVEDLFEVRTQLGVCFSSLPAGRSKRLSGWATAIRPTRLLKKVRLLTRPTPARQDALYPERGPSNSRYCSLGE